MENRSTKVKRETKETQIEAIVGVSGERKISIDTGVPFFDHMLHAFFFHGGFDLDLKAKGDLDVEPHHLVEDVGIVLGQCLNEIFLQNKCIVRFASKQIPMDDALAQAVVDFSGRPFLVYRVKYPQTHCGIFDMALLREFFYAFTINASINLHLEAFYGDNSHHIAEALFKASGKAIGEALKLTEEKQLLSTKGKL